MGNNIRIGKDFSVHWTINKVVDGERLPYSLVGKELQLYIMNDNGRKEVAGWKVRGNVIQWTFLGKDQKRLGAYQLVLVENADKDGMVTVDACKAFNLVAHSCEEDVDGGSDIVIETVTLESDVALAPIVKEGGGESYDEIKERLEEQDHLIEDLQNMKIDREADDYYPKLAVGLADNLAGVDVVDSEINFRRSGGGAITDGVARIESIKGNSVVWNQKLNYQDLSLSVGELTETDTEIIIVPPSNEDSNRYGTAVDVIDGHYYLQAVEIRSETGGTVGFQNYLHLDIYNKTTSTSYVLLWDIVKAGSSGRAYIQILGQNGAAYRIRKGSFVLRDLTQMFGTGNEPTTIEEFYARIPMGVDLNAYNEGEVIHMDVQSIESQGVNAWDEEWESGGYSITTGNKEDGANFIRTKNLIQVIGGQSYYITLNGKTCYAWLYDSEQKFIKYTSLSSSNELNVPSNCAYIGLRLGSGSAPITTYNHDICINLSDALINGKYFPYIKRVEDLSIIRKYFPEGMKSAGSAHDEIRFNKASGKWEKVVRIGSVDLGILEWGIDTSGFACSQHNISAMVDASGLSRSLICASLEIKQEQYWKVTPYDAVMIAEYGKVFITGNILTDTTPMELQDKLRGVILYYELAEPIVTELDEADQFKDLDYQVWNCGTENAIAEGKSAPLAADITYGFNAIGKIKELESLVAALRAKVGI